MLGFPEIHTMLWHKSLVKWADGYVANCAGPTSSRVHKRAKRDGVLSEKKWIDVAPHFCTELTDLSPIRIEVLCEYVEEFAVRSCNIQIDKVLVKDHVAPICQLVEPSLLLAKTICRCDFISEMLGETLRGRLRFYMHCATHGIDFPEIPNSTSDAAIQELVETRQALARLKSAAAHNFIGHYDTEVNARGDTLIARSHTLHDLESKGHQEAIKTSTLQWAMQGRIAFKHVPRSLVEAERTIQKIMIGETSSNSSLFDSLVSRYTLGRHATILDMALDELHKDRVSKATFCMLTFQPTMLPISQNFQPPHRNE